MSAGRVLLFVASLAVGVVGGYLDGHLYGPVFLTSLASLIAGYIIGKVP